MISYFDFKDLVRLRFMGCEGGDNHTCKNKMLHEAYSDLFIGLDRVDERYGYKKFFNEYCSEKDSWKRVVWLHSHMDIFDKQLVITLFKYCKKGLFYGDALEELCFIDLLLRFLYKEFSHLFN